MEKYIIRVENLRRDFVVGGETVHALRGVSFSIREGEFVTIMGTSGSGKSTLLNLLGCLDTATAGEYYLDGISVREMSRNDRATLRNRKIGFVFQSYNLLPKTTALENVELPLFYNPSVSARDRKERSINALHEVGLADRIHHRSNQMSGGQQQRIAIARSLLLKPSLLLLDEPFSALDSYLKWNLELELSELLADFGGPILWVSHDLGECCRNCRRVCVMEQGRSGEMTDMSALIRRPTTLGTAKLAGCRNFFPVRAVEGGVLVEDWGLTLPLTAAQERATLAIPDGAIKTGTGDLACTVRRIIPDLGCSTVLLLPDGAAADSPPLLTALPEGLKLREGERTTCALQPEQLLLF